MILQIGRSNIVVCITARVFSRNTQYLPRQCTLRKVAGKAGLPYRQAGAIRNTRKAFTLIEVMLSVAILSVALVMILQAFAHSLNILRITEDNLTGTLLAGNKMAEAQILAKGDWSGFENGVDEKFKLDDIKCDWEIDVTPVEFDTEEASEGGETLNEVNALLSWEEGKRKGAIPLATYMRSFSRDR